MQVIENQEEYKRWLESIYYPFVDKYQNIFKELNAYESLNGGSDEFYSKKNDILADFCKEYVKIRENKFCELIEGENIASIYNEESILKSIDLQPEKYISFEFTHEDAFYYSKLHINFFEKQTDEYNVTSSITGLPPVMAENEETHIFFETVPLNICFYEEGESYYDEEINDYVYEDGEYVCYYTQPLTLNKETYLSYKSMIESLDSKTLFESKPEYMIDYQCIYGDDKLFDNCFPDNHQKKYLTL